MKRRNLRAGATGDALLTGRLGAAASLCHRDLLSYERDTLREIDEFQLVWPDDLKISRLVECPSNFLGTVEPQFRYPVVARHGAKRNRVLDDMALHILPHVAHEFRHALYQR